MEVTDFGTPFPVRVVSMKCSLIGKERLLKQEDMGSNPITLTNFKLSLYEVFYYIIIKYLLLYY